ncbi:hypothetical protein [Nocardia abscessus]|uniref:hypothetical protein n=1 Tax=Nocardia abscessus TaxID=120957 RepID=UPI0024554458|nr:hypothetical protein [Nocardia abscessus]
MIGRDDDRPGARNVVQPGNCGSAEQPQRRADGIATVRADRSLRLVEPGVDVAALVARALEVHLA